MHALIIEQDVWIALMIEDVLKELGFTTFDIAVSGEDAIFLAEKTCPDLITSDVRLGAGNGIDIVRSICSGRPIKIVFVTATAWEVRDGHPDLPVVQKPFQPATLKLAVTEAIGSPPAGG